MKYFINLLNFVDKLFRVLNIIGVTYGCIGVVYLFRKLVFRYLVRVVVSHTCHV